ncbi:C40 family peptidase [Ascidiimonas aurantiaca]|uniref:C40 family peptidase n=1 Tax=Ascidiimonas aurantiaca TaxID=1685432 RepID=UPI0030ECB426
MKKVILFVLVILLLSCKSSKKTVKVKPDKPIIDNRTLVVKPAPATDEEKSKEKNTIPEISNTLANDVVRTALSYSGTRYKFGGTTDKGMDCSGLVFTAFSKHDISLNRSSAQMAQQGVKIPLRQAEKGDLLFFGTGKRKKIVNHVGLIVSKKGKDIRFIHATTSRGVLISSLDEGYWNYAFIEARRVLEKM